MANADAEADPMTRLTPCHLSLLSAVLALAVACGSSPFEGLADTLDAGIVNGDTTLFVNENATFVAEAVYGIGPGVPSSVRWGVSDTTKLLVSPRGDLSARMTARDTGLALVFALINGAFLDTTQVVIVAPGMLRWRASVGDGLGLYAAVGRTDSLIRVSGGGTTLAAYSLIGGRRADDANTCNGYFGPSVGENNTAFVTGNECTQLHSSTLGVNWTSPVGDSEGGLAIAPNGDAVVLHSEGSGATGAVVISRLMAATGVEAWRDTLRPMPLAQKSSLAIAASGDIYVAWRAPADSSWLTRISQAGDTLWTRPLPAWPHYTGPALTSDRVLITYLGGISVFDTAGNLLWSQQFARDNPGAPSDVSASSPVVDRGGNVYVQTASGLHSYTADGAPRWIADSLGGGSPVGGVGAPTVLVDTTVVISRGGNRVCGVRGGNGVPRWCSELLSTAHDLIGGASVGTDRTIFVTRTSGELIALWNRVSADPTAWTTEGGNHQRTRQR